MVEKNITQKKKGARILSKLLFAHLTLFYLPSRSSLCLTASRMYPFRLSPDAPAACSIRSFDSSASFRILNMILSRAFASHLTVALTCAFDTAIFFKPPTSHSKCHFLLQMHGFDHPLRERGFPSLHIKAIMINSLSDKIMRFIPPRFRCHIRKDLAFSAFRRFLQLRNRRIQECRAFQILPFYDQQNH